MDWLKNIPLNPISDSELLFVDETSMSPHPSLGRCWMKRGQLKLIPAMRTPQHLHGFGELNWNTTQVSHLITSHKNTDTLLLFSNNCCSPVTPMTS